MDPPDLTDRFIPIDTVFVSLYRIWNSSKISAFIIRYPEARLWMRSFSKRNRLAPAILWAWPFPGRKGPAPCRLSARMGQRVMSFIPSTPIPGCGCFRGSCSGSAALGRRLPRSSGETPGPLRPEGCRRTRASMGTVLGFTFARVVYVLPRWLPVITPLSRIRFPLLLTP